MLCGAAWLAGIAACTLAVPASAAQPATGATATPPAPATTLPPVPKVDPAYTAGQPVQSLLSTALALSSFGVDDSALLAEVSATQARMDADAVAARAAGGKAMSAAHRASGAETALQEAQGEYTSMAAAVRQAVVYLYMTGPQALTISPGAGGLAVFAADYAESALGPYGVLDRRRTVEQARSSAATAYAKEAATAAHASAKADRALADERVQLDRLHAELASAGSASVAAVTADRATLASQAGTNLLTDSPLQFDPKTPLPAPVSATSIALTWAFAELGKSYVWGATGPDTFDCSGLTQFVWKAAGVSIPRVAADQDAWTVPVPLSDLLPGDLVFFGTSDIHHVGIYIGDGLMINAPHTGTVVQVSPIWWSDLAGFGRVHAPGTPVPPHGMPTAAQPGIRAVITTPGPVPSQAQPPAGWKPRPGGSTPIRSAPAPFDGASSASTSTIPPAAATGSTTSISAAGAVPTTTTTTTTPADVQSPSLSTLPPGPDGTAAPPSAGA